MAATPRPYLWQFCLKRANDVDGLGGIAHYFTEEAQTLYLKDGVTTKELAFDDGHWQDAVEGNEENLDTDEYVQSSWTHPATGSLYGSAILPDDDKDSLYLLRYTYAKDVGNLVASAKWGLQVDNPINQLSANIKNYDSDAFTKASSLFQPGAKAVLGLTMGDSDVYKMGTVHLDDVDFKYNSTTVSISGRNITGYILKDSTFNAKDKKTDTIYNLTKWVLDYFGVENYVIQSNSVSITMEYDVSTTGLQALQDIADKASGFESGTDWDIEEMWDGTLVIGYNSFRATYLPKSVFKFGNGELFKRSSSKVIDGAYSKILCTGKDSNNNDLTPVIEDVTTWKWWNVVPNKTYFAPTLENTTQAELIRYAKVLAKQYKKTGLNESYSCTIKPQLLVGDFATVLEDGDETDIGIITQVNHTFGEKGFTTDFVADSGGDKQSLLTRSAVTNESVYTSTRRMGGDNRTKRLYDYIQNTAKQVVRTSGSGGGGGASALEDLTDTNITNPSAGQVLKYDSETSKWINDDESGGGNVDDVEVNGVSVVDANKIAKIKSYKELTQAQYNALPDSKLTDGILYAIKDASGGGGGASALSDLDDVDLTSIQSNDILEFDSDSQKWKNTQNPLLINSNYYTAPQLVGTWIDGKPLYEFTIVTSYSDTANIYMPASVTADWSRIFFVEAYIYDSGNHGDVPVMRDINAFEDSSNYGRANMQYQTSNDIRIYVQNTLDNAKYVSYGSDIKYVFVIRYTKGTDAVLDNYSMLHVKYSTNERVVGTWIDGKPLYEKTYTINMPNMADYAVSGTQITGKIYLDDISYGRVFMTMGFVHTKVRERFIQCGPLNYPQGSNRTSANIQYNSTSQRFFLDFFNNYSQWYNYASDLWITFTVRYTKTTD